MTDEAIFRHGTTLVRRLRLDPDDAMPWHRDPFHRITVVLHGDAIAIEFRDGTPSQRHQVTPGNVDREEPEGRIHRGVNIGREPYEEVTIFFLDKPDAVPQPGECASRAMSFRPEIEGTTAIRTSGPEFLDRMRKRVAAGLLSGAPHSLSVGWSNG